MILNFDKELKALEELLLKRGIAIGNDKLDLEIAMSVLLPVYDRGMSFERKRCLDIIARKAINAADLRAEINRPVR